MFKGHTDTHTLGCYLVILIRRIFVSCMKRQFSTQQKFNRATRLVLSSHDRGKGLVIFGTKRA